MAKRKHADSVDAEVPREGAATDVLSRITEQINAAEADLRAYRPAAVAWNERAITTAKHLIPWLVQIAPGLKNYAEDVLNAPSRLRAMWSKIRPKVSLPREELAAFDRLLALDDVLRESVTGEGVSNVVARYLREHHPASALHSNGRSDYPDLYLNTHDYSTLPRFIRKKATDADEYGAAVKGKNRPVRVPDGLEIKTCRERIAVDCHYPHAGLHLVLLFSESGKFFTVNDLRVAFLRRADYRETKRSTEATTVKYSFNGDQFVTLLPPGAF